MPATLAHDLLDHCGRQRGVAHVSDARLDRARRRQRKCLGERLVMEIEGDDLRAFVGQPHRCGASDARRCARDERDPPREPLHGRRLERVLVSRRTVPGTVAA
jgi:hypothetical protein